ncbi:MAG: hypothetical protein AB1609_21110 [Bacillota bacterium]
MSWGSLIIAAMWVFLIGLLLWAVGAGRRAAGSSDYRLQARLVDVKPRAPSPAPKPVAAAAAADAAATAAPAAPAGSSAAPAAAAAGEKPGVRVKERPAAATPGPEATGATPR